MYCSRRWKGIRGVSPVIAVILMVAITVVLSAVLYVTVQNIANKSASKLDTMGAKLQLNDDGWRIKVISGKLYNDTNVNWYITDPVGNLIGNATIAFNNINGNEWIDPGDSFFIPDTNRQYRYYIFSLVSNENVVVNMELKV